jgi:hypothetical protein
VASWCKRKGKISLPGAAGALIFSARCVSVI